MRGYVSIIKKTVVFTVLACIVMLTAVSCTAKRTLVIEDDHKSIGTGDGATSSNIGGDITDDMGNKETDKNEGNGVVNETISVERLDEIIHIFEEDPFDDSLRDFSKGLIFAPCEDGAAYKIVEYNGESSVIVIPSEHNGKPVIEIGERTFENNIVHTVLISDGLKTIGEYAFYYCAALETVSIPDSVSRIEAAAFAQCHSLKSINVGGVEHIGEFAFLHCRNLSDISLCDGIRYIGDDAFHGTGYYNEGENWSDNVLYMEKYLIEAKSEMEGEYRVKDGTLLVAANAFFNTKLTRVDMPESVSAICDGAFSNAALKSVSFGDVRIGDGAFDRCDSLSAVYYIGVEDIQFAKNNLVGKNNAKLIDAEWIGA